MSTSANTSENINIDTNTNANGCCTVHGGVRSEWKLVAAIFQSTYSQVSADPIWTAAGRRTTIWTAARLLYGALLQLLEDIVPPRPSCKRSCKLFPPIFLHRLQQSLSSSIQRQLGWSSCKLQARCFHRIFILPCASAQDTLVLCDLKHKYENTNTQTQRYHAN